MLLGEWKDGKRNGKGALTRLNGDVYEGNFSADQKNGHGIMRYAASGDVFEGYMHALTAETLYNYIHTCTYMYIEMSTYTHIRIKRYF